MHRISGHGRSSVIGYGCSETQGGLSRPRSALLAVIAALALGGMLAPDAGASFKGAPGKLVWSDDGHIVVGDPLDPESQPTRLGEGDSPVWSPDGTKIAFSRRDPTICRDAIWVMNADGTGARRVSSPLGGCGGNANRVHQDSEPSWSSDGKSIVFVRRVQIFEQCPAPGGGTYPSYQTSAELVTVGVVSGGETRILERLGSPACSTGDVTDFVLHSPDWSPAGSPIAAGLIKIEHFAAGGDRYTYQLLAVTPGGGSSVIREAQGPVSDGWSWSPDGSRLAVARYISPNVDLLDPGGRVVDTLSFPGRRISGLAYSPDGFHVYARVAGMQYEPHDHIVQVPDPKVEFDPTEEPDRDPPGPAGGNSVYAAEYDWQPQKQPIIFIHGFAGSRIACGGNELWPPTLSNVDEDLLNMRLAEDGTSPAPGACAAQPTKILARAYSGDVYQSTRDFLDKLTEEEDVPHYELVWDWRKDPRQQILALNTMIRDALDKPQQKQQGVTKVTLMGHSMGGLVMRAYLDDPSRAKKVARAVTIGTPYWGAPKSIFPLAAGIETPGFSALNVLLSGSKGPFQEMFRNLTGAYFLYPSQNYGPWLTVQGRSPSPLDRGGLLDYVDSLHGNRALLSKALDSHANELDGFKKNGVDYRAFVGTGLNTIGAVKLLPGAGGQAGAADVTMANGDGTVPARSGTQGPTGGRPLGDNVPISYVCGVGHVPLPGSPKVDDPLRNFLAFGSPPKKTRDICLNEGSVVHFTGIKLGGTSGSNVTGGAKATGGMSLEEAAAADKLQLLELPDEPVAITDNRNPVTISERVKGARLSVASIRGESTGATSYYGPISGELTLGATQAGAVSVLDDDSPVRARTEPKPGDPGTGTASSHRRKLSISYSKRRHAFKGKLRSDESACRSHQKVKVLKKRKGRDHKIGADFTSKRGAYKVRDRKPKGRYYAKATSSGTCLTARSRAIRAG